ncbi:hypothetical protein [Paraburkholderia hayleyella]|uniref:hypothetical protein n=1 Tax=Paraburkholderia hayleyella TaxID=2152889 RepID=UPI001FE4837D|nr:hypothetical protein [Paraburkholderia hayleyella]
MPSFLLAALALLCCLVSSRVLAADDQAALDLADRLAQPPLQPTAAPTDTTAARDWKIAFETAVAHYNAAHPSRPAALNDTLRASLTLTYDHALNTRWRVRLADQLDSGWRADSTLDGSSRGTPGGGPTRALNTLREAYISWQPTTLWSLDAGRINQREGVATGFNPTDFFKVHALRSVISIDPASLRENRQGTVMLRGQRVWEGGALTALIAPALAPAASGNSNGSGSGSNGIFNPDFAATNGLTRYLLSATQRLTPNLAPEFLLYGGTGLEPQFGVNLSGLLDEASVAFAEYALGRATPLARLPDEAAHVRHTYSKLATGLTHTWNSNLAVTFEYDYDGAAADRSTWQQLTQAPVALAAYRQAAATAQELPTRQSLFLYASWNDIGLRHLGLLAMARYSLIEHSYFTWFETRYHWPRTEVALQWQASYGASHSAYGAAAQKQIVQALFLVYF